MKVCNQGKNLCLPRILWVCVCSLSYTEYNAHVPCCHLWPARLYIIFQHYFINGTIFEREKKLWNAKCVFWFSLQISSETFLIPRRNEQDMIKNVHRSSCKVPLLFLSDCNETWIFLEIFRKILKYQVSCKSVRWVPSCSIRTDARTDGHDELNSRFSQFCERL